MLRFCVRRSHGHKKCAAPGVLRTELLVEIQPVRPIWKALFLVLQEDKYAALIADHHILLAVLVHVASTDLGADA